MEIETVQHFHGCLKVTLVDGTILIVPDEPKNADYVRVQQWVAAGGEIA